MLLNTPRSVERDNQNALRKYPFSDSAPCTNGTCVIVPGAIIDAQLYVPGRTPGRVWLSSVGTDGRLHFSDEEGEFAETAYPATAHAAVSVTFTGTGGPLPGGVVVFGADSDVATLRSFGGQTFTDAQTELAPSAVAWPGLPGITGFLLDDGHVVYGAVRLRGANGIAVATYVDADNVCRLRISAVGKTVETVETTGFIKKVVAESNNTSFVVSANELSGQVIDILATGVSSLQDNDLNADQDSLCSTVRKTIGTVPSERATVPVSCGSGVCNPSTTVRTLTLTAGGQTIGEPFSLTDGAELGILDSTHIPPASAVPEGKRFAGYFDAAQGTVGTSQRLYYRYDGVGLGRMTAERDVTLYAHFIDASSSAEVTFDNYGTLHLSAPNLATYTNPLRISGVDRPIPTVTEVRDDALVTGGADALAELVLHPSVPSGEVRIGLRGLNKASSL